MSRSDQFSEARFEIRPTAPYSFALALSYLTSSPSSVLEEVDLEGGQFRRALRIDGADLLLTVRATGDVKDPMIEVRVGGQTLTPAIIESAKHHVERIFLFDVDLSPFHAVLERDSVLGSIARDLPGVRPLLVADPYEALLFAIAGQQVNIAFARRMKLALIEQFGRRVRFAGREMRLLPEPERIAELDPADLLALQFSRQKARYLVDLSQSIASGHLALAQIGELPLDEAIAELTRFRGIGRWTAEYVLLRGLGIVDSIPAGDLGLRKIIGFAYGLGRTASEPEVREIAEAWAGWRGWGAFLWWLELQTNNLSRFAS